MGVKTDFGQALYDVLTGDVPLMAVAQAVYNQKAPQADDSGEETAFPYVVIGQIDWPEYSDSTHTGFEVFVEIETISRSPGAAETEAIQDLIYDAVHRQQASFSVSGHSVLIIDREGSLVEDPNDLDGSFTGVCSYRALITKDAAD